MSKSIFIAATLVLGYGIFQNIVQDHAIAGTGTMAMNTYYLLSIALYAAAGAARLIFEPRD